MYEYYVLVIAYHQKYKCSILVVKFCQTIRIMISESENVRERDRVGERKKKFNGHERRREKWLGSDDH